MGQKLKKETVCYCNCVERTTIESAITQGANTLNKIFDTTTAGVGACGGSCRVKLQQLLEGYQTTGQFPQTLSSKKKSPKNKK